MIHLSFLRPRVAEALAEEQGKNLSMLGKNCLCCHSGLVPESIQIMTEIPSIVIPSSACRRSCSEGARQESKINN